MNPTGYQLPESRLRSSAAAKSWQWLESPTGDPIYWPPYHGIHESLFAFACRCAEEGYDQKQTSAFIHEGLDSYHTRRTVTDYEVDKQVQGSFYKVAQTDIPTESPYTECFDRSYAQDVFENRLATRDDLERMSPLAPPTSISEALSVLYKPYELINLGTSTMQTKTRSLSEWLECTNLVKQEFIVPHPMTARVGVTKDGRPHRPRTRSNTGPRRWVIVEFDHPDPDWQPSLILELADIAAQKPAVVLWSGQKSLHSWWEIGDATPCAVEAFENEAIRIGGDRVFFGDHQRAQMARLPMATRKSNGNIQQVIFWNVCGKEEK